MRLCNRILLFQNLLKAQHVSSGTPLIIRSSKLYLQPLVYIHMWWPAVAKAGWEIDFPLSVGNGNTKSRNINKLQLCNRILLFQSLLKAQHVSRCTPLIIRSSKLYLQPLDFIRMWWPAVVKAEWEIYFPLSLGNGQSTHVYINQRLQIQFRAPDDERHAARNMLSLQ